MTKSPSKRTANNELIDRAIKTAHSPEAWEIERNAEVVRGLVKNADYLARMRAMPAAAGLAYFVARADAELARISMDEICAIYNL